jgi:hypothetical protein
MPSTFSTSLRLELIGNGEQAANWGNTTNTNLGTLLEQAITGVANITMSGASTTLSVANGVSDQSRNAVLVLGGTLSANANLIVPAVNKLYVVRNATTGGYSVTVKTSAGTGVTLVNGFTQVMYCDGTNVVLASVPIRASDASLGSITATKVVIADSSTSELLRITQTGTGNALLVEDSANPDSSPFIIDASGRVVVGYTSASTNIKDTGGTSITPQVQIQGTTPSTSGEAIVDWSNSATSPAFLYLAKSKSGTIGTQGIVTNGDTLGSIVFNGDDGANFSPAAAISGVVDGVPGQTAGTFVIGLSYRILTIGTTNFTLIGAASNTVGVLFTATGAGTGTGTAILTTGDMPGRLSFSVTSDGSGTPTERVRISSGAATLSVLSTNAMLLPVGTEAERPTPAAGYIRFNSTSGSFEGYNGTLWGSIGGGAAGGGADKIFYLNDQTVTTNYSIPSGQNAGTFGPITINSGATVTIPSGSTWTVT